ncbi:MAG TPA: type II toxin-antitoxin system VapC family toxin [Steroidobacteraceae bacterium]
MYLVDTDVISEARKGAKGNTGVKAFFHNAARDNAALFLSAITIGELRQGVEMIRYRGDGVQAQRLERWLNRVAHEYADAILPFDDETAHIWGRLRVPHPQNPLDKQIAATALIYDLAVVTRNSAHYAPTGVRVVNPFT